MISGGGNGICPGGGNGKGGKLPPPSEPAPPGGGLSGIIVAVPFRNTTWKARVGPTMAPGGMPGKNGIPFERSGGTEPVALFGAEDPVTFELPGVPEKNSSGCVGLLVRMKNVREDCLRNSSARMLMHPGEDRAEGIWLSFSEGPPP